MSPSCQLGGSTNVRAERRKERVSVSVLLMGSVEADLARIYADTGLREPECLSIGLALGLHSLAVAAERATQEERRALAEQLAGTWRELTRRWIEQAAGLR